MDIYRAIRELEQEKQRLDGAISSLEELIATGGASKVKPPRAAKQTKTKTKRGRKEMTAEERLIVSERMRKYWEERRSKPAA